jgi:hypothetical protein
MGFEREMAEGSESLITDCRVTSPALKHVVEVKPTVDPATTCCTEQSSLNIQLGLAKILFGVDAANTFLQRQRRHIFP